MKLTKKLLERLEDILKACGYRVRYERGTFSGGFCVLKKERIVVLNKIFTIEGRINLLLDLLPQLELDETMLEEDDRQLLQKIRTQAQAA
ncbi:MAG: hypothetical protein LW884_04025 [Bacteroidetes bacterium]|jgi:hypothetical protein|nr:hypothetical protein [Bacteroidota bacterium]